jgi:hypothetical protein
MPPQAKKPQAKKTIVVKIEDEEERPQPRQINPHSPIEILDDSDDPME